MNRRLLCGLVLMMIVFTACAQTKKTTKKKKKVVKTQSSITSIDMHRTACYGKCPDYRLILTSDGTATYIGRKFAPYPGTYVKKINADKVQELFRQFERYRVDTCSERYKTIPDIPHVMYTITMKGNEKNIDNANSPFAPKFLKGLADEMDKLTPIDGTWKKTESWTDGQK